MKSYLNMKILGFLVTIACVYPCLSQAQTQKITGQVLDQSDNSVVPGASVINLKTKKGITTNTEGHFEIDASNGDALQISFIGYDSQKITITNQNQITITLKSTETELAEMVVTGYQVENRKEITGAVSTIKPSTLNQVPSGNVEQQFQGRVSGVTVISNGQPGTDSKVRIRGFGAFRGNEPLYIVDGIPMSNINIIPPSDIENTTILKDAASASIYGARASNGVIVITTKKGKENQKKIAISYDGTIGFTAPGKGLEVLNPQEQADWTWIAQKNSGIKPSHFQYGNGDKPILPDYILNTNGDAGIIGNVNKDEEQKRYNVDYRNGDIRQLVKANKQGTNWWNELTRLAPLNRHSLSFSGAGKASRYYTGLNYQSQAGIFIYNNFERYSLRTNSEFDLSKRVRIGETFSGAYVSIAGQQGDQNGQDVSLGENHVLSAFRMSPIIPVYDEFGGWAGTRAKGFNNAPNRLAYRTRHKDDNVYFVSLLGSIYTEIDILKNLRFRSLYGGRYTNHFSNSYDPRTYENSENSSSYTYTETYGYSTQWNFTNTLSYSTVFGKSNLKVIAGTEALNTGLGLYGPSGAGRLVAASGLDPFSEDINFVNITNTGNKVVNSFYNKGVNMYSLFGKTDYSFDEKYILSTTLRRDGSSSFGRNNRYAIFPAFSAAWRVSDETFFNNINWISDLKIRGGWGITGNTINVSPSNQFTLFGQGIGTSAYDIAGTNTSARAGFYRSQIGNPNAKWESNRSLNLGFDAILLNGKVEVVFDWWKKKTTDLLFQPNIPRVTGISAIAPYVNVGSMLNRGIDFLVVNKGKFARDWSYEATFTVSFLHNEILSLAPNTPFLDINGNERLGDTEIRNLAGYSLSSFFGFEVQGLFQNQQEIDQAPKQTGAGPGRFRYRDLNKDGEITTEDRTILGSPIPDFTGGLNLKLGYKNFELETFIYTSLGNDIYNTVKWYTDFYPGFPGAAISSRAKNSWSPTNTNTDIPIFETTSNFSTNGQSNSYYIEKGSYLRMTNLQISYSLPKNVLKNMKLEKLKVFAQSNNLFTLTKYSGLDPSVGGSADTNFGIDTGNYPISRAFNLGISVGF